MSRHDATPEFCERIRAAIVSAGLHELDHEIAVSIVVHKPYPGQDSPVIATLRPLSDLEARRDGSDGIRLAPECDR